MKLVFLLLFGLMVFSFQANGQTTQTLDIVTFAAPIGWTKDASKSGAVIFTTTDETKKKFCLLGVYKSRDSLGDTDADFKREWEDFAARPFEIKETPELASNPRDDGWTQTAGALIFDGQFGRAFLILTVYSGHGKVTSAIAILNDESYSGAAEDFVNSITLKKPAAGKSGPTQKNQPDPNSGNSNGISISTTNFDDGWTSTPQADHVRVTKGDITVYLFYGVAMNEQMRPPVIEVRDYFWRTFVAPQFNVQSAAAWNESYSTIEFIEGKAVDNQTGKSVWVAMNVVRENGVAKTVVAAAPDKAAYLRQFPHPDDLGNMLSYNKFAVSPQDILGTWQGGSSTATNYYEVYTGNYAGMNFSAMSDDFIFDNGGTYQSMHKGASGMIGATKTYQQKYNGKYSATTWEISATNRHEGKSTVFEAWFEAVKGGRILHLTDKQFTGIKFHLVKVK